MYCENCGNQIDEIHKICHGCGVRTDGTDGTNTIDIGRSTTDIKSIADNIKKKDYCQHCGNVIDNGTKTNIDIPDTNINIPEKNIIPIPGIKIPGNIVKTKKSGIAAVLSFLIPGLGQIYRGRIGAGSIFLLIGAVLIEINRLLIESPDVRMLVPDIRNAAVPAIRENIPDIRIIMFIVIYIIFWIYNMHHAYTLDPEEVERRIKRQIEKEIEKM